MEEAWFLGLRLNEGVSLEPCGRSFLHLRFAEFLATIGELEDEGLVSFLDGHRVALTARGRLLLQRCVRAIPGRTRSCLVWCF